MARAKEYRITDFDENGEETYTYFGGETIIEEVECNRCKTKGKSIQDIAVWEKDREVITNMDE